MNPSASPREIVDRQLLAYNSRDIDAYCALFASNAVISKLNVHQDLAQGIDAIRKYYTTRFSNPKLHCEVKARIELGDFVIDHEQVIGVADGSLEVIAIYEVRDSLIQTLRIVWP